MGLKSKMAANERKCIIFANTKDLGYTKASKYEEK
jgi:hypothetical protein